jgi:hypothetical protein
MTPAPSKIKTALYVRPDQLKTLRKIAEAQDVSLARLVREGIDLVIKKYSSRKS